MQFFTIFNNRSWWQAWVLLNLTLSTMANSKCNRPEIKSPISSLFVYQRTATVNVTVHSCLYHELNKCDVYQCYLCPSTKGFSGYTVIETSERRYSDLSQNCLKTFKTDTTTLHSDIFEYQCSNYVTLKGNTTAYLTTYEAKAYTIEDRIVLRSGTVCRFSLGFCHDEKENLDVIWKPKISGGYSCGDFRKIDVSNSYLFTLNNKTYTIIESRGRYFALKRKDERAQCGVIMWNSEPEGLVVSEAVVPQANQMAFQTIDHLRFSFGKKQDLYDFLVEMCDLNSNNVDFACRYAALVERMEISDQNKLLREEVEEVKSKQQISFYLSIFSVVCLASFVIFFVWYNKNALFSTSSKTIVYT